MAATRIEAQTVTVTLAGGAGVAAGSTVFNGRYGKVKTVKLSAGAPNHANLVSNLIDTATGQVIFADDTDLTTAVVKELGLEVTNAGGSAIANTFSRYCGTPGRSLTAAGASGNAGTLTFVILWEMTAEEYMLNNNKALV